MNTTIDKADERIVSIQRDDVYDSVEDALGDGFVFRQGSRNYPNYDADFDPADYPEVEHWFVLDVYEHGGIVYSLTGEGTSASGTRPEAALFSASPSVTSRQRGPLPSEGINEYVNGEVYWYAIEDGHGNLLDSCGGFIGAEDVIYEVNGALEHLGGEVTEIRDEARDLL